MLKYIKCSGTANVLVQQMLRNSKCSSTANVEESQSRVVNEWATRQSQVARTSAIIQLASGHLLISTGVSNNSTSASTSTSFSISISIVIAIGTSISISNDISIGNSTTTDFFHHSVCIRSSLDHLSSCSRSFCPVYLSTDYLEVVCTFMSSVIIALLFGFFCNTV